MPRNVRNFWATIEADGRNVSTGPRASDGIIDVQLLYREKGGIGNEAVNIRGRVIDGNLMIVVEHGSKEVYRFKVER